MGIFDRNIHTYTIKEQLNLHCSSVAVIGIGGGGSCVAEILARTGVGKIVLVDGDRFEESNQNRQIGAVYSTKGQFKAECMARRIQDISKYCETSFFNVFLGNENYKDILNDIDIVCDTVDGKENKLLLGRYCKDIRKICVTGGLGGYGFWSAILKNKSVKNIYKANTSEVLFYPCASGVFAQAALQAQQIINVLLGRDWGTIDRIIKVNFQTFTMSVEDI